MLNGIININKDAGLTSHDIVKELRKILDIKKIGHAGTLDPSATGVLPVCIGKATRLIQFLPTDKQYIAEITLGISTDTYDRDGKVLEKQKVSYNEENIKSEIKKFIGEIEQQVPATSATHYKGEKLYKYAHKGIIIEDLPTKIVKIYNIEFVKVENTAEDNPIITLIIDCSTGTYIRSIANDLGEGLGYGAYLSSLIRTVSSGMNIDNSVTLNQVRDAKENNTLSNLIISPADLLPLSKLELGFGQILRISKGQYLRLLKDSYNDKEKILLLNKESMVIGIGEYQKQSQSIFPVAVLL